jgi:hypothetical protein
MRLVLLVEALLFSEVGTAFGLLAELYLSVLLMNALKFGRFAIMYQFSHSEVLSAIAIGSLAGWRRLFLPGWRLWKR